MTTKKLRTDKGGLRSLGFDEVTGPRYGGGHQVRGTNIPSHMEEPWPEPVVPIVARRRTIQQPPRGMRLVWEREDG